MISTFRLTSTIYGWLLLFVIGGVCHAQLYPVTGSLSWTPPYSPVLNELALPSASNNFRLSLLLNDQNTTSATVKLRFKLEGSGIRLQTEQNFIGLPITLINGVPEIFYGADLQEYVRATSLQFQGMSREAYLRNAAIPDGFYKVSFQVFEQLSNQPLSDEIFTNVFLATNEIPLTVFPACSEKLRINDPQYIMFSWLNRAVNFSASEYEFQLFWVQPKGRPAGDVVLSSIPIYTTTTTSPSLIYTSAEPALIPGEEYVWRVQARDQSGLTVYKQQGYSQPCKFQWGDACSPPENVKAKMDGGQRATISWDPSPAVLRYTLEYRPKFGEESKWYPLQTTNISYTLSTQLKPTTWYEYRVKNVCGTQSSEYSPVDSFRTEELFRNRSLSCGARSGIPLPDSTQKLQSLKAGDKITMGGFTMTIISANGYKGRFSGKLQVPVRFLNTTLEGNFSNLGINSDYQVYSGVVDISAGNIAVLPPEVQKKVDGYLETLNVLINRSDGGLATATSLLNNSSSILSQIESIAETVTGIDSTLSGEMKSIHNEIKNGLAAIGRGDSTEGSNILKNAWEKLGGVFGGGGNNMLDKLKEFIQQYISERRITDSTEESRLRFSFLRNARNAYDSRGSIIEDRQKLDLGGTGENEFEPAQQLWEGEPDGEVASEELLTSLKSDPKLKIYIIGVEGFHAQIDRLKYLTKSVEIAVVLLSDNNLKELVENVKTDSQRMGTTFLKDIMNGKIDKTAEDYIKGYLNKVIEYRIQEAIGE
ncbi:MAG: fibronectin type III domain-containing protein [Cytophagaceae bacterium]|nr:fibronectin type III domain-containing protein [Cytophagaceae bacterium]